MSALEFGSDVEMRRMSSEAQEFFEKVLYDEEPLFVSDEATLWGVWMGDVDEVLERCSNYYGVPVSFAESQQPLWKLLRLLNEKRAVSRSRI